MSNRLLKRELRGLLQKTDAELAEYFGISRAAIAQWGEEDPIPELRQLQVETRNPELFEPAEDRGQVPPPAGAGAAADDSLRAA